MAQKILLVLLVLFPFGLHAQNNVRLSGKITEAGTKIPLAGVNIAIEPGGLGTITDAEGHYQLHLPAGTYVLRFSYIGFESKRINLKLVEDKLLDMTLEVATGQLEQVVVTAGRFEQRLSEVTVSMEVIKPDLIEQNNLTRFDDAMDRVPGVSVVSGQLNIRGTSGFSYGAGSRVQVLVDDMPLLSADAGDVKWAYLPIENVSQIEVIKGAASTLFGSSALGGIVNLRTAYPTNRPRTQIQLFSLVYDRPNDFFEAPYQLRDGRHQSGISALHSRQVGKHDLTAGMFAVWDQGYRIGEYSKRVRGNMNWRYRINKRWSFSLNTNGMVDSTGNFFFWKSDTAAFFPSPGTNDAQLALRYNIDPVLQYFGSNGRKHIFRNRLYFTQNRGDSTRNTRGQVYYNEYQYQQPLKLWENTKTIFTGGLVHIYNFVNSGPLYGLRDSRNLAAYVQLDQQIGKLNYSAGMRYEQYVINNEPPIRYPVVRLGANYELFKASWLRASFGQGFRTPSVAERYVNAAVGALLILPNPALESESGWSTELGWKQGWQIGKIKGFADLAAFWTQYENMIEFSYRTDFPEGIGFKALNLTGSTTMIRGIELSSGGAGEIGRFKVVGQLGYTFIDPVELRRPVAERPDIVIAGTLKYRTRHLWRSDIEVRRARWGFGTNLRFNSFMLEIDEAFEIIIPGVRQFRQRRDAGDFIADFRISYEVRSDLRLAMLLRNAFNRDYMIVPGNIGAPRTFGLQLTYTP
ncbi:MAG: TonB-dependent receptor [Bacteroidia bacterium]